MTRLVALLLAITAALTACGDQSGSATDPRALDLTGAWVLTAGTGAGASLVPPAGASITLRIKAGDASGVAACNHYGGPVTVTGSTVRFGTMAMTEMACEEPLMSLEADYLAALAAVTGAERSGDTLQLTGPDVSLSFAIAPAVPPAPLVGTTWRLDTLIDGDVASSVMGNATLLLAAGGTISGSTGCHAFRGTWSEDGDRITVDGLTTNHRACKPDLAGQNQHVLTVLRTGFTTAVQGDVLTVAGPDGAGLRYRAGK